MHNALRWFGLFRSQKQLYVLFILLFLVPNFVLFVTEPQPVLTALASFLLPLAGWMALLLVFRKPGIMAWILLPKIILDGGQLVLLCLFGESVIAVDMFLNLTSSNSSEAGELLSNILLIIVGVCCLYTLPTLYVATRSVRIKDILPDTFRRKGLGYSAVVLVLGILCALLSPLQDYGFSLKSDVYPANAAYNLYFALHKAERNKQYAHTSAAFTFNAVKPEKAKGKREVYVLVVGETSRAMEWSLYGYGRKTTPRMDHQEGLVFFRDAVTQSNNTHKSVPIILSAASAEDYDRIYSEKSILTAFKEAGFRTVAIVNQKLNTSMIGAFYHEADRLIDLNTDKSMSFHHDGDILPTLQEELDRTDQNLFVVIHTYGSHFNYYERYPKEFALFTPDKPEGIRQSAKAELRNAYDNSIYYTDYVLSNIIGALKRTGSCASMLYLSDHGEDIFDDARARYLHASPIPTYYQLHIPYVIWFSDTYQQCYEEKYRNVCLRQTSPVSTNSVFHTMLDMAGIQTPILNTSLALTNPAFVIRDRMYLDDHDDPIPFWHMGLKQADFAMLDQWHIAYTN